MSDYVPSKIYFSRRHIDSLKMNNRQAQIDGQFAIINSHLTTTHLLIKRDLRIEKKDSHCTSIKWQ